jgi:hypothetical protein
MWRIHLTRKSAGKQATPILGLYMENFTVYIIVLIQCIVPSIIGILYPSIPSLLCMPVYGVGITQGPIFHYA